MEQWGNVRVGEQKRSIFSLHPWLPRKKKTKVKKTTTTLFLKYLRTRLSQIDRLKVLNFKGFTDLWQICVPRWWSGDSGQVGTGLPKGGGVSGEMRSKDGGLHAASFQKSSFLHAFTSLQMDAVWKWIDKCLFDCFFKKEWIYCQVSWRYS